MKCGYLVIIVWSNYDQSGDFCVCETEADAQEMILSLREGTSYDNYIAALEFDTKARPQHFFHEAEDDISVRYKKIVML